MYRLEDLLQQTALVPSCWAVSPCKYGEAVAQHALRTTLASEDDRRRTTCVAVYLLGRGPGMVARAVLVFRLAVATDLVAIALALGCAFTAGLVAL